MTRGMVWFGVVGLVFGAVVPVAAQEPVRGWPLSGPPPGDSREDSMPSVALEFGFDGEQVRIELADPSGEGGVRLLIDGEDRSGDRLWKGRVPPYLPGHGGTRIGYPVRAGETLPQIAQRFFPDDPDGRARWLAETGRAVESGNLRVGQPLFVPAPNFYAADAGAVAARSHRVLGTVLDREGEPSVQVRIGSVPRSLEVRFLRTEVRAWLGVSFVSLSPALRAHLGAALPEGQGVLVTAVHPGSPAKAVGMEEHDVLFGIDDLPVASAADLTDHLESKVPGDPVNLRVLRRGEPLVVSLTLGQIRRSGANGGGAWEAPLDRDPFLSDGAPGGAVVDGTLLGPSSIEGILEQRGQMGWDLGPTVTGRVRDRSAEQEVERVLEAAREILEQIQKVQRQLDERNRSEPPSGGGGSGGGPGSGGQVVTGHPVVPGVRVVEGHPLVPGERVVEGHPLVSGVRVVEGHPL